MSIARHRFRSYWIYSGGVKTLNNEKTEQEQIYHWAQYKRCNAKQYDTSDESQQRRYSVIDMME